MGLKDLFINSDETEKPVSEPEKPKTVQTVKFPSTNDVETPLVKSSENIFNSEVKIMDQSNPYLAKMTELYNDTFDKLNKDGYDFYEFYKAVTQIGVNNQQAFIMAFTIGSTMDKTLSKSKLLEQADFYITELTKVYEGTKQKGLSKRDEINSKKHNENQILTDEVSSLEQQIEALTVQLNDKKEKLKAIDSRFSPQLNEIDNKLSANETAKTILVKQIQEVIQGINTNLN